MFLKVMEKGPKDVAGLTDAEIENRLGPKRANRIRTTFALRKSDDVRKYIVKREIKKGDKTFYKSANIQRLITDKRLRRKAVNKRDRLTAFKKGKEAHVAYEKLLSKFLKEKKASKTHEKVEEKPKKEVAKK